MKSSGTPYPMHPDESAEATLQNHSDAGMPFCGAKTRSGAPCRNYAMKNGRCRMHGGASTGRKTLVGIASHRAAVTIHGGRSREMIEFRRQMRELQADARRLCEMI